MQTWYCCSIGYIVLELSGSNVSKFYSKNLVRREQCKPYLHTYGEHDAHKNSRYLADDEHPDYDSDE